MKRLLLLGGSRYALPVIEAAHNLGYYVITCDYLPDNIAHKYSDEYCNVSIIDKEAVLEAAKKLNIDGIMSFACDPGVATAAYVAEKMGLPHSGSYESVSILQNKGRFRQFLTENGFNVPMAKGYTSVEEALDEVGLFNWPIIVKPTDSAGSKGVTRVDNPEDLEKSIQHALSFSHSNEFIIEDFLEKKGHSSDTDSFSVDGKLKFVSFSAQRFDENCENPYTPSAYSWPSTISQKHQDELTDEIQRLLSLLNMKTSIYNIEVRECTDGKAYIMECSPRGGGNRLAEMLRYATGVDLITNAVRAAVGEPVIDVPLSQTVRLAKEKGYSEPDPRIDLSGKDVIRKLVILAREAGYKIEQEDVEANLFIPDELFNGTLENFWERLPELDNEFEAERQKLEAENMHWRFIARFENNKGSVSLCKVQHDHPFYTLEGSNNIVLLTTERYKEYPMLIQGYGAGASVTAAGVFADIMRIANI